MVCLYTRYLTSQVHSLRCPLNRKLGGVPEPVYTFQGMQVSVHLHRESNSYDFSGVVPICVLALLVVMLSYVVRRVRKIAKSDYELRHVCPSAWNNLAPTGWISMECVI